MFWSFVLARICNYNFIRWISENQLNVWVKSINLNEKKLFDVQFFNPTSPL